jgi:2,3-bisphosphoglycerate-independent phosphoglycerate mutase
MVNVFVLFLDGFGLGTNDPELNPLASAHMPFLSNLLDGRQMLASSTPYEGPRASLLSLDARLGIEGRPQSATGQAVLLTGRNVPSEIEEHYGPKPNPAIMNILRSNNLFNEVLKIGGQAALLNAYPPSFFKVIESGRRMYSAIQLAAVSAGLSLRMAEDLRQGNAFSVDFTGEGWSSQPNFPSAPVYAPEEAGRQMALVSSQYRMSWFDCWLTDYLGHRGTMSENIKLFERFDQVLQGLVANWDVEHDLIALTSDHGNLEDSSARGHTLNPVPLLLIGPMKLRRIFSEMKSDLTSFAPAILQVIKSSSHQLDASAAEQYDDDNSLMKAGKQ